MSDTESSVESSEEMSDESYDESSDESSEEVSDESSAENSDESPEPSAESSLEESSDIEQSSGEPDDSQDESSAESSIRPGGTDESSSEPSYIEQSSAEPYHEYSNEESETVMLTRPRKDPLNWMAGIGTVLPIQKPPPEIPDESYPTEYEQYQSYTDVSVDIGFASDVGSISMTPITDDAPSSIPGTVTVNVRALLVSIIIFALIGMAATLTLIIIIKKSGNAGRVKRYRRS